MKETQIKQVISIVIPTFNEEENIPSLIKNVNSVFKTLSAYNVEFVFVDDASTDQSLLLLKKISHEKPHVKVLSFSRNFGKEVALTAGCRIATGDAVITMDGDLQHPAELIPQLLAKWNDGAEVVYTVRKENKGASYIKRLTSYLYWWSFVRVSSVNTEPRSTDYRLIDRKVIDIFNTMPERGRLFRGMIDWLGFKRARVEFIARKRKHGQAGYSYIKLIQLAINSFTAFSLLPLRIAGYLGILITTGSVAMIIFMFIMRWFVSVDTFTALAFVVVANTFLIGIVLISLGFIALYIARIHDEVAARPLYVVREQMNIKE